MGWNILSARVSVFGSRVRCAFYITDSAGEKVPEADSALLTSALPKGEYRRRRPIPVPVA
jgi:UTP:GlnB (protein PII) uridylyltransferase